MNEFYSNLLLICTDFIWMYARHFLLYAHKVQFTESTWTCLKLLIKNTHFGAAESIFNTAWQCNLPSEAHFHLILLDIDTFGGKLCLNDKKWLNLLHYFYFMNSVTGLKCVLNEFCCYYALCKWECKPQPWQLPVCYPNLSPVYSHVPLLTLSLPWCTTGLFCKSFPFSLGEVQWSQISLSLWV